MKKAGLIGVGLLGSALAKRLTEAGFEVHGFDTNPEALQSLSDDGGLDGGSSADVIRNCDQLMLSLPTSDVVTHFVDQHRDEFREGQILLDTTTGDPRHAELVEQSLAELGVRYLEATVAGSSMQVRTGNVALFLGGDSRIVEKAAPLISAITSKSFHLGPVGTASRFKLVHNLLIGLNRAVLAEGLAFAEALGFDAGETLQILKQTPAASRVMETKGQRMVEQNYEPQARLSQHLKDVRLILSSAELAGSKMPLSEIHESLLETCQQLGFGESDNSAVIEAYRNSSSQVD